MFQAATFFGAGILAKEGCAQLPACSAKKQDGGTTFKLSVQVHAASVPGLGKPGAVMRLRPRLGVGFGGAWKETEFADFAGAAREASAFAERAEPGASSEGPAWVESVHGCSHPASGSTAKPRCAGAMFTVAEAPCQAPTKGCSGKLDGNMLGAAAGDRVRGPWRFGDTLTFSAQLRDLTSAGLRLRLAAHSDMVLGLWQVDLPSSQDFGEAVVSLQRLVLPACVPTIDHGLLGKNAHGDEGDRFTFGGGGRLFDDGESPVLWWESPILTVPLVSVSESPHSGVEVRTVARVAVSFRINSDPEVLLREAEDSTMTVADRFERAVDRFARWMQAPVSCASCEPGLDCDEAMMAPRYEPCKPEGPTAPLGPQDEPEAEAAPLVAAPAAVTDWSFKL